MSFVFSHNETLSAVVWLLLTMNESIAVDCLVDEVVNHHAQFIVEELARVRHVAISHNGGIRRSHAMRKIFHARLP